MDRLRNKVVLFIGAGEHLGRSAPLLFAQEGAKLVIVARRKHVLEETAEMIRGKGGEVTICQGSATKKEDIERMMTTTLKAYGKLDVLYNNIGGGWVELDKKLHEITDEAYERIIASNLTAIYNTSKAAVIQFLKQGEGGAIVNIAASENVRRMANPLYAYTKAGMIDFAKNLANDYLEDGIRVNCLLPGLFVYEAIKDPMVSPIPIPLIRRQPKNTRQGEPSDLAYAGLFLASDEASFITGQAFAVDGGDSVRLVDLVLD